MAQETIPKNVFERGFEVTQNSRYSWPINGCALLALSLGAAPRAHAQRLFWANNGVGSIGDGIGVANLRTSMAAIVLRDPDTYGVAIDVESNRIYWTAGVNIRRCHYDGSNIETVYSHPSEATDPFGLVLHAESETIYFVDYPERIRRLDLMTGDVDDIVTVDSPTSISRALALDVPAGKLYWVEGRLQPEVCQIRRADLDGSFPETVFPQLPAADACAADIVVDPSGGKLYFSLWTQGIFRVNLDGTGFDPLVSTGPLVGGLSLDLTEGKLYWVIAGCGTSCAPLRRSNLDGSGVEGIAFAEGAQSMYAATGGLGLDFRRPGDCTSDRVLDLHDVALTTTCLSGPHSKFQLDCSCADSDGDGKVSLRDFADFQREFHTP